MRPPSLQARDALAVLLFVGMGVEAFAATAGVGDKGPVFVGTGTPASGSSGKRRLLAIGVSSFDDPSFPALSFAEADARDLAAALVKSGGFVATVLTGVEGRKDRVTAALEDLSLTGSAADTVVVYVSTHGTLATGAGGGLKQVVALRDTRRDQPLATGLPLDELVRRFEALASRRKVLILATCYSGAGKSSLGDSMQRYLAGVKGAPVRPLYEVSSASVVLSASAWGETAREDPTLGHDIYTHFFIAALAGFDENGDGATSVIEAHDFARQETYRFSHGAQRPTAILTVEGEDPIVLAGRRHRRGRPVLLSYDEALEGFSVRVDGTDKGTLPRGIVVEAGWHEIVLAAPGAAEATAQKVFVGEGETLSLSDLWSAEPARQLELHLGALVVPGSRYGARRNLLGGAGLAFRVEGWLRRALDVELTVQVGGGRDVWRINDQAVDVDLQAATAALAVLSHFEVGRLKLGAGIRAGAAYVRRAPAGTFYSTARQSYSGGVGAVGLARLRLVHSAAVGLRVGGDYLLGQLQGLSAVALATASWSF
ncbi:MAG: caspase family protein [Deltaproteobacteria bacterium]|nr:caspase family protein [Deltaproteobacteria bacterium]